MIWRKSLMTVRAFEDDPIPTNRLIPYPVIICAVQGDPTAMDQVIVHFNPYIAYLSRRNARDEEGFLIMITDPEIEARLISRLVRAVVRFKIITEANQLK
ncbi:MAG: helix-turn-helix domain-containing protein [Anaerolineaceae bacterium]|nr:helix-turn-helix domain-containing protein [Anaerolineaceae bacterium]